jgi:NitT/TauT family transport system substrate-binding protein
MLRFTGDIWKNHPCCVVAVHERDTVERPAWTQKVTNAIVKAQIFASANKPEVARLLSRDGGNYLPVPGEVVLKAITDYGAGYDGTAIRHRDWGNGRIDFQPFPYPSATKLIVEALGRTVVEGDTTFLNGLDPDFVARDLYDYRFVEAALKQYPEWVEDNSVDRSSPFTREEVLRL